MEERRTITISPATRIEGHGKITIFLDEFGNVSDTHFQATEIRGFEQFLRGMDADRLPFIVSRICGVCSTAHVIASVKAIESAFQVEVPETAAKIRELLMMAQLISNNSLVFFFLTLPDFYFSQDENPSVRNVFEILRREPKVGKEGMVLRMFGTRLYTVVGGREVHIVSTIPGGQIRPLSEAMRNSLLGDAEKALAVAKEALDLSRKVYEASNDEFRFSKVETNQMGLTENGVLSYDRGSLKVVDVSGRSIAEFQPAEYQTNLEEKAFPWTYAKFAYLKQLGWPHGILKVGPTARLSVAEKFSTPLADEALKEFRKTVGRPAHQTMVFDYARLIELFYACERAVELLKDKTLTSNDVRVQVRPREGRGIGVVEAPRGTLFHDYQFDGKGNCTMIRLIVPTQINNAAINVSVKNAAFELIKNYEVQPGLLNRVETVVRAYDPCIKCATRSTGKYITVEVKDFKGNLVKTL